MQRAFILINPAARGGQGEFLWNQISPTVPRADDSCTVFQDLDGAWKVDLKQAMEEGVRLLIAAGGDGTVHALLQGLVDLVENRSLSEFSLGAVGLGSSNDFHKPFRQVVKGVPLTVHAGQTVPRDIGLVTFVTPEGNQEDRSFLISASMGLTAEGNHFFNTGKGFFRWLKGQSSSLAIFYTALRTIFRYQNRMVDLSFPCPLTADGAIDSYQVTNLSVTKTPYVSGSFRFDTPVSSADGNFAINLTEGLSRIGMIRFLSQLGKGRFLGIEGNHHWSLPGIEISSSDPFFLELDGEVFPVTKASFTMHPEKINLCTSLTE